MNERSEKVAVSTEECGRLSPQGYPCELPQGHGGLCDYEDARADWEKEPPEPDGECYRGTEYASALAEDQAEIQRTLK